MLLWLFLSATIYIYMYVFDNKIFKRNRSAETTCSKCYGTRTLRTTPRCRYTRIDRQVGRIPWTINCSTTVWFLPVLQDLIQACGKFLWWCGRIWTEVDVRWETRVATHQLQMVFTRCSSRISKDITRRTGLSHTILKMKFPVRDEDQINNDVIHFRLEDREIEFENCRVQKSRNVPIECWNYSNWTRNYFFQGAIWIVLSRCLVHTAASQGGLHFVPRYHSRDGRRVDRNELAGNSVGQKSYAVAAVAHVWTLRM